MKAEIIAVGTEILLGQIVNTNATYIAKELASIGIDTYYQSVVGDNAERLEEIIATAENRSDLIILCGGLGPTKDDLTKQTTAHHLGKELVIDAPAMAKIEAHHQQANRVMTLNNRLQALVIEDSTVLKNSTGLAAGIYYQQAGKTYILLPGPPSELKPMVKDELLPLLINQDGSKSILTSRVLRFYGIGESQLVTILADLIENQTNPTIAPYAKINEVTLRITAKTDAVSEANSLLDQMEKEVLDLVGDYFYAYGDDETMAHTTFKLMLDKKLTLATAESLTAGLFAGELANLAGSSKVLVGGAVTYAPKAKEILADVPGALIEKYGTVSSECAIAMAEGIRNKLDTDLGMSFTGVAGPEELENKKVGTVWIGLAQKGKETIAKEFHFPRTRQFIRNQAVMSGFDMIRRAILETEK